MATSQVFYKCQRCGNCCKWPGWVKIGEEEAEKIASFLNLNIRETIDLYMDIHESRKYLVLKNKPQGDCVFFENNGCKIHSAKPNQCAGFPNTWNFPNWRDGIGEFQGCKALAVPLVNESEKT